MIICIPYLTSKQVTSDIAEDIGQGKLALNEVTISVCRRWGLNPRPFGKKSKQPHHSFSLLPYPVPKHMFLGEGKRGPFIISRAFVTLRSGAINYKIN